MDYFRRKFRDFLRRNTKVELTMSLGKNEPVWSIWVFGYLIMRKRFDYVLQEWVDLRSDERIIYS